MRRRFTAAVLLLWLIGLWSGSIWADCSTSNTSGSLGSVPSTQTDQVYQTRVAGGLSCTGAILQLLGSDTVNATLTGTRNNFALTNANGDRLPYRIYGNANFNEPLSVNSQYSFIDFYVLNLAGLFGGPDNNVPLFIRTRPTRQLSAGTYRDTIRLRWNYSVCTGLGALGICLGRSRGNAIIALELTMTITPDCLIDAPDVNFGSAPLVSGFSELSQSISLFCTKGSSFQVGLSAGSNARGNERYMASSSGELLRYWILKPDGTPWRDVGSGQARSHLNANLNPGPGLGGGPGANGSLAQGFNYRAVIDPDQTTPSPGTYIDQVIITVQF